MPIYQYECRQCGHELEQYQSMKDEPLVQCPICNKNELFRVLTGGLGFFMANRTLGVVADKNSEKYSEDYKTHLNKKNETKKVNTGKLPKGAKRLEKPKGPALPEFNDGVTDAQLNQASPIARKNYIETGKLTG